MRKQIILVILLALTAIGCNSGDAHFHSGSRAYERGDYVKAANDFETAIKLGTIGYEKDLVLTALGNAYSELNRFDESIDAHRKAVQINSENYQAWVNLGVVYRLQNNFEEAERCYMHALELKPDYAELHVSMGALSVHKGEPEKAVKHLEHALELPNPPVIAYSNLGLAYAAVNRFEEAEAQLKKAVELGYENAALLEREIRTLREKAATDSTQVEDRQR